MNVQDLRTVAPATTLTADVCIVGSGPVGLTLADELSGSRLEVIVLESGSYSPDEWTDRLNDIESIGAERVMDQNLVRRRALGGTSTAWCGRLAAFDDIDFEERPWVRGSGWPVPREELTRFLPRTLPHLGAAIADNTDPAFVAKVLGRMADDHAVGSELEDYLWSYSQDDLHKRDFMRFGQRALARELPGVRCFLHATVTHIDTSAEGSVVTGIEVTGADGRARRVVAAATVLCAGGIENARIMLASNRTIRQGVGNTLDQVGRCLMDHPRRPVAVYRPVDFRAAQRAFSSYRPRVDGKTTVVTRGVRLSRAIQEQEQLLNAAAWLNGKVATDDPLAAASRLARLRAVSMRDVRALFAGVDLLGEGAVRLGRRRSPVRKLSALDVTAVVEQPPNPESRVMLADAVDALGVRRSRIDWRVGEQEVRTLRRIATLFEEESRRHGLPAPQLLPEVVDSDAPFAMTDVAHPMGTTRMSETPQAGVVDTNCAVHGVGKLFVAGASVFPTAGHANPTQTAVALAVRLADHLKATLVHRQGVTGAAPSSSPLPTAVATPLERPAFSGERTILVTGATGTIGRVLVPLLVQRGYTVRAMTSRLRSTSASDPGVEWVVKDLRQNGFDFRSEVAGCNAVIHLGAELEHPPDMRRTNAEATAGLARAAESERCRFMCYASSVSVYGSARRGVTSEDAPTLSPDTDVPAEYWGNHALRRYGRTKFGGEHAIRVEARDVEYVILRPTVVVDLPDIEDVLSWGIARRVLLAHRNTQHIHVRDVAAAIVWVTERSMQRDNLQPGVSVYNVADETLSDPTFAGLVHAASVRMGRRPLPQVAHLTRLLDWSKDYVRYGREFWPRRPIGMMTFSATKLASEGFRVPHGLRTTQMRLLDALAADQASR